MNPFKICPKCTHTWKTKDDLLQDPSVCLVGFQADFRETEPGHYLFNHILAGNTCNTTMAVKVDDFLPLYNGPMFEEIKFGSLCAKTIAEVSRTWACARSNVKTPLPVKSWRTFFGAKDNK